MDYCKKCKNFGCNAAGTERTTTDCEDYMSHLPTNADRIRQMTDEELADFLWSIGNNPATGNYYLNGKLLFSCADGNGWLDWLRQEVTDGT